MWIYIAKGENSSNTKNEKSETENVICAYIIVKKYLENRHMIETQKQLRSKHNKGSQMERWEFLSFLSLTSFIMLIMLAE